MRGILSLGLLVLVTACTAPVSKDAPLTFVGEIPVDGVLRYSN